MSIVYSAIDTETGQAVAVKFLARALTFNAYARAQFRNDVEQLHKLGHPDAVPILHFGQHREQVYLVMPLCDGGSLHERLNEPMSHLEAARLLKPIASALDAAQAVGRLHLNLKPSNILFNKNLEPKLSDFSLGELSSANSGLISENARRNASYLSPELIEDRSVTGRSDVYSLTVLLFQMISGRMPYRSTSAEMVEKLHCTAPIPKLYNSLDLVFETGMAKSAADRPETATALLALLPEIVVPTAEPENKRKWWRWAKSKPT